MASAEIVAIGSELLLGQIVDTNSAWIAQRLTDLGVDLFYKSTVGDNPSRMKEVIGRAAERSDIVITSGGLGPTQDDLTREVVAEVAGRELVLVPELLEEIEQRFRSRGFIMTENNERQAYIPEGAVSVHNPNGTAPAFVVESGDSAIFALPGVPHEMKWLFDNEVAPYLRKRFDLKQRISYRILKVADIGESAVDDKIGHLITGSTNPTVGVLAHPGQVDVRIAAKAGDEDEATKLIAPVEAEVRELLGRHVFAADDESMENVVGALLRQQNVTVAAYEDLTSGQVAERLQRASPDHFAEGVISNGPRSIQRLLGFSRKPNDVEALLMDPEALVDELAWAVRSFAEADLGLAVHAVAEAGDTAQNLGRGQTNVSITDGTGFRRRTYNFAGGGTPDRIRTGLNTLALVRLALTEGFE